VYQGETVLLARRTNPDVWVLRRPKQWERVQKRSYVRLEVTLDATLIFPKQEGEETERMVDVQIEDLSAGGVKVSSDEPLPKDTELMLEFELPGTGEVIRNPIKFAFIRENQETRAGKKVTKYVGAGPFLNLPQRTEDLIAKFIFTKQLELRRMGLL